MPGRWRLNPREREQLEQQGFVVRRDVFTADESRAVAAACEALIDDLVAAKRNRKVNVGSYTFEMRQELGTIVKWEQDHPDLVQGIEPFAHLSETLRAWALDARLVDPAKDVSGSDDVELFTEKLNLPNESGDDRRALLCSYQPAGNPHLRHLLGLGRPMQTRADSR